MAETDYKRGPLFSKKERKLIDAYAGEPQGGYAPAVNNGGTLPPTARPDNPRPELLEDVSESDVESRLRNDRASMQRTEDSFREFVDDLHRLKNYYRYIKGSPVEFHFLCQNLETEIERLELLLEEWKGYARTAGKSPEDLARAYEPLRDGLLSLERTDRYPELNTRSQTVHWILRHDYNVEIVLLLWRIEKLTWRVQMSELKSHRVGEKNGTEYAGQELGGKKELVECHPKSTTNSKAFKLTDRGTAVLKTVKRLCELDRVWATAERNDVPILDAAWTVASEDRTD